MYVKFQTINNTMRNGVFGVSVCSRKYISDVRTYVRTYERTNDTNFMSPYRPLLLLRLFFS